MDLTQNKTCIISCGIGGHYPVGVDRLERSLIYHGSAIPMMLWRDYPIGCPPHIGTDQYAFKIYAFEAAFAAGYTHVLWCDASLYAVKNPMPIFDFINDNGLYFFRTGYSLAQTATDNLCDYINTPREALALIPEVATGLVGINLSNPDGKKFWESWKQSYKDGMFGGSRNHDEADSQHKLFRFSRQDQSAASAVLFAEQIPDKGWQEDFLAYYGTGCNPEKLLFFVQGI